MGAASSTPPPGTLPNADQAQGQKSVLGESVFTRPMEGEERPAISIEGFFIRKVLGSGSMGQVYEVERVEDNQTFAMKVFKTKRAQRVHLDLLLKVSERVRQLDHPSIAKLVDHGMFDTGEGKNAYIILEIVRGKAISKYATERAPKWEDRLELLLRVMEGVEHAHEHDLVHRDLRPNNILVNSEGQPKILDYGLAEVTDCDVEAVMSETISGAVLTTLNYLSPEQAMGAIEEIIKQTDIYGLGVLGYILLSGRLPYNLRRKPIEEAIRSICEDAPAPITELAPEIPAELSDAILKAMEKEPGDRWGTVSEFLSALRAHSA